MGDFTVKVKDQLKLEVICKIESGVLSREDGRSLLHVSERTLRRYIKKYREQGIGFLRHGNCLRKPLNKTPDPIKETAMQLVQEKYYDFNMLHCLEKLKEEMGVTLRRETFRKWCHERGCVKRAQKRRSKPRKKRQRMSQPGMLLQMDGSHHRWFGGRQSCLIAIIDDATNEVHAEFFEGETTVACLKVLKDFISKKGAFKVLYTDKAGVFGGLKRHNFSQVERALSELGTQVIYAHSPEAKGRVERLFGTLQDRLIPEMRLNKIRTLEQANEYLQKIYLAHNHNPRFMVRATTPESAYRPIPQQANLDSIFCVKEYRVAGKDHTISLGGEKYMIADELKFSISKQKIEIRYDKKGYRSAYFAGKKLKLVKIDKLKKMAA